MGHLAAKRGIQTIVLTGKFGVPRPWKINETKDLFTENSIHQKMILIQ